MIRILVFIHLAVFTSWCSAQGLYTSWASWPSDCDHASTTNFDCRVFAEWSVSSDSANVINISLTIRGFDYITIAWAKEPLMSDIDIISAQIMPNGSAAIINRYAGGQSYPNEDSPNLGAILDASGSKVGDTSSFTFQRKLNTGDTRGVDVDLQHCAEFFLFFVYGSVDPKSALLDQHADDMTTYGPLVTREKVSMCKAGEIKLQLATGSDIFAKLHATAMVLAWLFFNPVSTAFARYLKHIGHIWFSIHQFGQIATTLFCLVGFIIEIASQAIVWEKHQILGVVVIALTGIQALAGMLRNRISGFSSSANAQNPSDRGSRRWLFQYTHRFLGWALLPTTIACVWLGMDEIGIGQQAYYVLFAWIGLTGVLFICLEGYNFFLEHYQSEDYYSLNDTKSHTRAPPQNIKKGWSHLGTLFIVSYLALTVAFIAVIFSTVY